MQSYKPDLSELNEFRTWNEHSEISLATYAAIKMTSPDLLIATICLFYPSFVVVEDCVIVDWKFDQDIFDAWKREFKGDMRGVEFKMNYRLVGDFFGDATQDLGYQNIAYIGHVLMRTWESALKEAYPERRFKMFGDKDGDLDDFWITFCQEA